MPRVIIVLTFISFIFMGNSVFSATLKVGVSTNYQPVIFKDKGEIVGIEADLAKGVGEETNMKIEFVEMPWEQLEAALNEGKVDVVMSGVSITKERSKRVDFADPYMNIGQMVLIKADNIMSHSSKMSMYTVDMSFGVENNTTGQQYVKSEFPGSKIVSFESVRQGVEALKADKIDYFVHDAPTIWQYTVLPGTQDKELFGLYEYMTDEPLAWAVKKGNAELLAKLNKALINMQSRGLVLKITNQWIPVKIEVGK